MAIRAAVRFTDKTKFRLKTLINSKPKHYKDMKISNLRQSLPPSRTDRESITKIWKIMRLLTIFLFAATLQISAKSYSQTVSLTATNISLQQAFSQINEQTGYSFFINHSLLEKSVPVTVSLRNATITQALEACLKNQPFTYRIIDKMVILKMKRESDPASSKSLPPNRIGGMVIDSATKQPLAGVTIAIKGENSGTVTDAQGKFSLEAPDNAVLEISYLGYTSKTIPTNGRTSIEIALASATTGLNQLVVVGYGTQKKGDITGSISIFDASDLNERPVTRVDQALVGQMAGVHVNQTTGVPGKAFSVQIRGSGSISAGNEPLYVIDGLPLAISNPNERGDFSSGNPLDNINPNDIASIEVLKDASAAAIYGSRAANGVVLITTKSGKVGKPAINLSTYIGFSTRSRKLDVLSAQEWIDRATEMINAQWVASGTGRTASQTTEQRRQILGLQPGKVNADYMLDDRWAEPGHPGLHYIDWQNETFKKGYMQNTQLSASGGNENVRYYISGNYVKQDGIVIGMNYTNYSARANVDVNVTKNLKIGLKIAPSYSLTHEPGAGGFPVEGKDGILMTLTGFTPVQEDLPGNVNVGDHGQYTWGSGGNDPVALLKNYKGTTKRSRTLSTIFAEYQILDGLSFRATANLDNTNNTVKYYAPYTVRGSLATRQAQLSGNTRGNFIGYRKQTFVNENTLTYDKTIHSVHHISVLAGTSYNTDNLDDVRLESDGGFVNGVVTTLNAAAGVKGYTTETKDVLLSYFGRIQYGYNSKYLLSASLRRDGSSRFGKNTKWGWFPSASLGWRISDENFMKNLSVISNLKFRASFGESGNYNIGDYSSIPLLATNNYTFNQAAAFGQAPDGIVNPDLSWEKSRTLDVGFDLGLFKNRITVSADYYNKLNTELLLNVPLPAVTGFTSFLNNVGKVRNKGWEFEINSHNLTHKLKWTTSFNISHNTNEVIELAEGQTQILIPSLYEIPHRILKIGEPMYSIYVIKQIGILSQEDIDNGAALYSTETVGDPKYFDANKDGVIDANDRVIVGHPGPDYTWGITNRFSYKGFDLSVLIQGQQGGSIYSLFGRSVGRTDESYSSNVLGFFRDRWRSPDDPGNGKVGKAYSTFGRIMNTDWLYSSDYWRIRNITLGYDLGRLNTGYLKSARVYVSAENWFGKDKYYGGYNPESKNADMSGSSTFPEAGDYGGLPLSRSITLGINLTF